MSGNDDWSPDEPLGTEAFEQGDEALDDDARIDPRLIEEVELDPALNPTLLLDERELDEAGVALDDPEQIVVLDGGIDDPDGLGEPTAGTRGRRRTDDGWDLGAPLARGPDSDPEATDPPTESTD